MTTDYLKPRQPDILEVISNLSNDEVFTPPHVTNAVLDMLPADIWRDPNLRWLDPGCKTGVFPREIAKRLMIGLEDAIPDEGARLEHILKNMVFAIAITELTSLMATRTLYCSKDAGSEHSVVSMPSSAGNVWFGRVEHSYDKGRCAECGGTKEQLERDRRDNHAYGFIHGDGRQLIEREMDMKFDVIVGNPPYQMEADSGGQNITPLYDTFVEQAKTLNPRFISMIIPSRWMVGGKRLDDFRANMLGDQRIRKLVDYAKMDALFPGVDFEGGICYFLWDRDHAGRCDVTYIHDEVTVGPVERTLDAFDIFVRDPRALPILEKVLAKKGKPFSELVSTRDPFGPTLASNFAGYRKNDKKQPGDYKLYMNQGGSRVERWVDPEKVTKNHAAARKWKVLIANAYGERGVIPAQVLGATIISEPRSVCTLTYLFIGPFDGKTECESVTSYLRTRFARFLVSLRKISQHTTFGTYAWLPIQEWNHTWTDNELYRQYGITKEEQAYIAEMIREMPA
jgi:site-specific DNA-methyltransferase (adenine-specific)